jgi:hypothetical protein
MAITDIPVHVVDLTVTATDDNSNSATLTRANGDLDFSGLMNDGRVTVTFEAQGAWIGSRLGGRSFPTVKVTRVMATPNDAWNAICQGKTAGFTSVAADLGDAPMVDLDLSFDYGADNRDIVCDDCELTDYSAALDGSTESYTFVVRGPVVIDGTTYISSR